MERSFGLLFIVVLLFLIIRKLERLLILMMIFLNFGFVVVVCFLPISLLELCKLLLFMIKISYKGGRWEAEKIKSASLSTGYNVYLFKRYMKGIKPILTGEFVVAVKSPSGATSDWSAFTCLKDSHEYYLNCLCCYA